MLKASSVVGISNEAQGGGLLVLLLVAFGVALTLLAIGLVQVATARAVVEIARGDRSGPGARLPAGGGQRGGRSSGRSSLAAVAVLLLSSSLFLIPVAIWLAVRWALIAPVIALEGLGSSARCGGAAASSVGDG